MKLINDDCLEVFKTIETESIDCVVTDCPYKIIAGGVRIAYENNECGGILNKKDWSKTDPKGVLNRGKVIIKSMDKDCDIQRAKDSINIVKDGKMFAHNDIEFSDWLPEVYRVLKKGTHCYIMVNARNLKDLQEEAEKVGFEFQNLLVWHKTNTQTPNKYYMQNAEFILMLSKRPAKNINKMGSKTVISIPNIIGDKVHPTEKPIFLNEYLIENSTNESDIVLDPFMGAGSCGIACKKLKRNFIGIEIDKQYYDIAVDRINKADTKLF
jgi:site-specific DNA-methyltransferase (adenine-specific)